MPKVDLALKITRALSGVLISVTLFIMAPSRTYTDTLLIIITGLLTSILLSLFFDNYKNATSLNENKDMLNSVFQLMADKSDDFDILSVVLRNGFSYIPIEKFPLIWLDVLWRMKDSYHATIISSKDELDLAHNQLGLDIQDVKVKVNKADVRRVFILDDERHFSNLHQTMLAHKTRGLKVRYVLRNEINENHLMKPWLDKAEALDFSIVDSKYILLIVPDDDNHISRFRFTSDTKLVDFYKEFYKALFSVSKDV